MSMRIVNWNVQWAKSTARSDFLRASISACRADVICLTEVYRDFLNGAGHAIDSEANYGYKITEGRRKVLLWSRNPWRDVDQIGSPSLPPGRFVAGTTSTPIGDVRFVGVCIPWRDAHVRTGRQDKEPWEDHLEYLSGLQNLLRPSMESRTVVLGDFNQTIPRTRAPMRVYGCLEEILNQGWSVATSGDFVFLGKRAIDHVICSQDLIANRTSVLNNQDSQGKQISDHFGSFLTLNAEHTTSQSNDR